jgi:hypothetical protein
LHVHSYRVGNKHAARWMIKSSHLCAFNITGKYQSALCQTMQTTHYIFHSLPSNPILQETSPSSIPLPRSTTSIPIPTSQPIRTPRGRTPPIRNRQPVPPTTSYKPTPSIHPLRRIPLEPPRQIYASKIRHANRRTSARTEQAIQQRARINVASVARPARRQCCRRIPAHAE